MEKSPKTLINQENLKKSQSIETTTTRALNSSSEMPNQTASINEQLKEKPEVILFHSQFLEHHKYIFSLNFLAKMLTYLTGYAPSTIKKDLIKKNNAKLKNRITNYLKNDKLLENDLKKNKEKIEDIKNLAYFQILISENKDFDNKFIKTLQQFLTSDEIRDLKQKNFKKGKLVTLKASYFIFKIYLEILYPELNINEILKRDFKYLNEQKEKNWLKTFFSSKRFSDKTEYEKRHLRNIINQKNKLKFQKFEKYLNEEYKQYDCILLYAEFLYIDYLEMLKKSLNINQDILDQFVKSIN